MTISSKKADPNTKKKGHKHRRRENWQVEKNPPAQRNKPKTGKKETL